MNRRDGFGTVTILGGLALLFVGGCGSQAVVVSNTVPTTTLALAAEPTTSVGPASALFETTTVVPVETSAGPVTTVAEVTTLPAPNPCEGNDRLPGEALEFREFEADMEGDGLADLVTTYAIPMTEGPMRWRARLDLATGGFSEVELTDAFGAVGPVGAVQVDRNATSGIGAAEEVLVVVGTGVTTSLQVLAVDELGCLVVMGDGLGASATLAVGAEDDRSDGLRCESTEGADYLVQLEAADAGDATSFATTDTRLQRIGTNLVPFTVTEGTASIGGEVLPRYSMLDCTGVTLPTPA